jgi:tRNA(Ile)-lysidine synthase
LSREGREPPPDAAFDAAMARLSPEGALGAAVSGGGDSTALMQLAAGRGLLSAVATVDHGLRDGSAGEAAAVARAAAALGLPHETLRWEWDGSGNLQAAARDARRRLLAEWAGRRGLSWVLLGHTLDDQAETLVMRLARGSGVEGLSAMEEAAPPFLRPLLGVRRAALRGWLTARGVAWAEDPANDDPRFERVRARRALDALGLDPARLAHTAARMARAREGLERRAVAVARALLRPSLPGDVALDRAGLAATEEDTRLRILAGALRHVSGAPYRPREADLIRLAADHGPRTLHGCCVVPWGDAVLIHREPAAVAAARARPGEPWDGAWILTAPRGEVRALGAAAPPPAAPDRGAWSFPEPPPCYPRAALAAKPALWDGPDLVGFAPLRRGRPHGLRHVPAGGAFPQCLLTRAAGGRGCAH